MLLLRGHICTVQRLPVLIFCVCRSRMNAAVRIVTDGESMACCYRRRLVISHERPYALPLLPNRDLPHEDGLPDDCGTVAPP